jgi:hypothetical protein
MKKHLFKPAKSFYFKNKSFLNACLLFILIFQFSPTFAQSVLFDFDNAPLSSPLPISQTMNGITAYFTATGQGYSIQNANTMGFTPAGFAGRCIYPSSINLSDLHINFDQKLSDFSIMYSCQELGCDDAATMRVTAFKNGVLVGTNTKTAGSPGTWPVDKLSCSFPQGFDSVVVHYDSRPPTCQDYGVIFLADNMRVTPVSATSILNQNKFIEGLIIPNPVLKPASISFTLLHSSNMSISIYDLKGKLIQNLIDGFLTTGEQKLGIDLVSGGIYFLKITSDNFTLSRKLIVLNQ